MSKKNRIKKKLNIGVEYESKSEESSKTSDTIQLKRDNKVAELVELCCPGCGAALKMVDKTHARCEFCGKTVLIDEATGTDIYIDVDNEGMDKIKTGFSIAGLLAKYYIYLLLMCIVVVVFMLAGQIITDNVETSVHQVVDEKRESPTCLNIAMEIIFQKKYKKITQEEFSTIRYLSEDYDSSSREFVIQYSFDEYSDYDDFEDYSQTFQECRVPSSNVARSTDLTMFTGLEVYRDRMDLLSEQNFATKQSLECYVGSGELDMIMTNFDVSNIRELHLTSTESSLTGLEQFANLEILSLEDYCVDNIDELEKCLKIKRLTIIGGSELTDFSPLLHLHNMEELYMDCHHLKSVDFVGEMTHLKELSIQNGDGMNYSTLKSAKELKKLKVCQMPNLTDLSELSNLEELEIRVYDQRFSDESLDYSSLATLSSLKKLTLYSGELIQPIIKSGMNEILNDKNLESLTISNLEFVVTPDLLQENNHLKYLELTEAKPRFPDGDSNYDFISRFKGIDTLILKDNKINQIEFAAELKDLRILNVEKNYIFDFSVLQNSPKLEELFIGDNATSVVDLPKKVQVHNKLTPGAD